MTYIQNIIHNNTVHIVAVTIYSYRPTDSDALAILH